MVFELKNLPLLFVIIHFTGIQQLFAQDELILQNENVVKGEVLSVEKGGGIKIKTTAGAVVPYTSDNIKKLSLAERKEFQEAQKVFSQGNYDQVIKLLEPLKKKFFGLKVGWVVDAAVYEAEANLEKKKTFEAEQLGKEIADRYRGTEFEVAGHIILARVAFIKNDLKGAETMLKKAKGMLDVKPIPTESNMRLMSAMTFSEAEIYEKKGQKKDALENYLKVAMIYYKPEQRAVAAQAKADKLQEENPDLTVD